MRCVTDSQCRVSRIGWMWSDFSADILIFPPTVITKAIVVVVVRGLGVGVGFSGGGEGVNG